MLHGTAQWGGGGVERVRSVACVQPMKRWPVREVMDGQTEGVGAATTADATAADREVGRMPGC